MRQLRPNHVFSSRSPAGISHCIISIIFFIISITSLWLACQGNTLGSKLSSSSSSSSSCSVSGLGIFTPWCSTRSPAVNSLGLPSTGGYPHHYCNLQCTVYCGYHLPGITLARRRAIGTDMVIFTFISPYRCEPLPV